MSVVDELWTGEHLSLVCAPEAGLRGVIAVDDTTLGPGLGGVRYAAYPDAAAAAREARRLAAGMTLKNALAGLPFGGAKSVIIKGGDQRVDRAVLMRRFGEFVARLGGSYLPGVDMGTSSADLLHIADAGATVSCALSDPSPWTAAGVFSAILAAQEHHTGSASLDGARVLVQGVGHVGRALAERAAAAGARVLVSDVDDERAQALADQLGGRVVAPAQVLSTACEIFAPCATARVLDRQACASLPAQIVAGAANDLLAVDSCAQILAGRGITYVPDFLANAGGVIQIHAERSGWGTAELDQAVSAIGDRARQVLAQTPAGVSPLVAATAQARSIIAAARRDSPSFAPSFALPSH